MGKPEVSARNTVVERYGRCLCGNIRHRLASEPRVHYCNCDMCRHATGNAVAALAWVPVAGFSWLTVQPAHRPSSPIFTGQVCCDIGLPHHDAQEGW
jgi:hypothetical protein